MIAVDVIIANLWMAFLLYGAGNSNKVDNWFNADSTSITKLKKKIERFRLEISRIPNLIDTIKVFAVGFGIKNGRVAKTISMFSDAIIIGSSIVELIEKYQKNKEFMHKKIRLFQIR